MAVYTCIRGNPLREARLGFMKHKQQAITDM